MRSTKYIQKLAALSAATLALTVYADPPFDNFQQAFEFDQELTSMDLNVKGALLPLGPGWSPILVDIHLGESASLASKGKAFASSGNVPPNAGDPLIVSSFFDVFFDINITDVDPFLNFGGGPTDGLSLTYPNNGPAHIENLYFTSLDPSAPNFGLIPPPEAAPSIGFFEIEIPFGADFNGNGENDKMKFTLVAITAGDANRTFVTLPDGTIINTYDAIMDISGAIVDESQDPPFGPITLTGPVTATTKLVGVTSTPDGGSTLLLLTGALAGLCGLRRIRRPTDQDRQEYRT
jgi:hypothetical protein